MNDFINPAAGARLTSPFGTRTIHGKKEFHKGIDLAKAGTIPIQAAASGKVIRIGPLGTYGNIVIIQHSINGIRMDTLYAHLKNNSIEVKVGDKVSQGQRIAFMGATDGGSGRTTGQHLHFEIHAGAWATGQPNAVDPLPYIEGKTVMQDNKPGEAGDELEFSSSTLETSVYSLIKNKEKQKEIIKKASDAGVINKIWLDKYNRGQQKAHDILGVCVLYTLTK